MYRLTHAQKAKVKDLLSRMTLEEKIGQMNQESVSIVGGFDVPFSELIEMLTDGRITQEEFEKIMSTAEQDYHEDDIRAGRVGSLMVQEPEKCNELQKIAVEESRLVGQMAGSREEVIGAWAISWKEKDCVSIQEGLENAGTEYQYFPCCGPETDINEDEVAQACAYGDVIVAVVGELDSMSGEASSRADITLPGRQRELLEKLLASGKPVVAVLMNGRPLALKWEAEHVPALLECWHLGVQMGNAVANILLGIKAPEGKLASSFPAVTGMCPIYYNHPNTGRPGGRSKFTSRYLDAGFEPLYPFGYGLSYTTFAYDNMEVTETADALHIMVDVSNTGDRAGVETVQLYMQDVTAGIVRPVKELKGFAKAALEPGEKKTVSLTLDKKDMGFYTDSGEYVLEDGKFRIYVGGNSRDCLTREVWLKF